MTWAAAMLVAGCSGQESRAPVAGSVQTPAPTPTPSPSPTPTPSPTPAPTPTPTPAPTSYRSFADVYTFRSGPSLLLPSACGGFAFQGQPPAVLATTPYGQGLNFRWVLTPQVWTITGDLPVSYDARHQDPAVTDAEVARILTVGADTIRFAIRRPMIAQAGLDYARLAAVSGPVGGVDRLYHCVIGISTLATDLPTSPSGGFTRNTVMATAYVRDGATSRSYNLGRSVTSIAVDPTTRRVTLSVRLIGMPTAGGGADVELGTVTATATIDSVTGNFVAPLASTDRTITGTISGRFFGPQAVEIGVALGATVADAANAPGYSFAGAVFGTR